MRIWFVIPPDPGRGQRYLAAQSSVRMHYDAYVADLYIEAQGQIEEFSRVPLLYFTAALQSMLLESFITGQKAEAHLWDTGLKFSLENSNGELIALEIPCGAKPLRYPRCAFIQALKEMSLDLLLMMHADEPQLLLKKGLFDKGSFLDRAAQLVVSGKLSKETRA